MALTFDDPDHSYGECRLLTFGKTKAGELVVSHIEIKEFIGKADMREEYNRSDLGKGIRGKYYKAAQEDTNLVKLDPEVAKAFPTEKAVNEA